VLFATVRAPSSSSSAEKKQFASFSSSLCQQLSRFDESEPFYGYRSGSSCRLCAKAKTTAPVRKSLRRMLNSRAACNASLPKIVRSSGVINPIVPAQPQQQPVTAAQQRASTLLRRFQLCTTA
jgi:hypothetical protein